GTQYFGAWVLRCLGAWVLGCLVLRACTSIYHHASIPQRLPCLQSVPDAIEGLGLAAELEERLALQVQQVVLGHGRGVWKGPARQDEREGPSDQGIVIAEATSPPSEMHTELQSGEQVFPTDRDFAQGRRLIASSSQLQRSLFGIGHEPVAV